MHGRLKLRPPDAARRRQREEKLRLYQGAMKTLLGKKERGELDWELLELTGTVLGVNPDVGTCWNLRRLALPRGDSDWVQSELALVGRCLGTNPKSYGAWHHRLWILSQFNQLPLPEQQLLCDRLLEQDPRNFHAWEHRRALAQEEDVEAELVYTGTLLGRDFSNFSAWHHRGRLLGAFRDSQRGVLGSSRLLQELELVQSAVFTDPNDLSAWGYLRCLLTRGRPPPRILSLFVNREEATLALTFSRPLKLGEGQPTPSLTLDGSALQEVTWRSGERRLGPAHTWLCHLPLAPPPARPHLQLGVTWEPGSAQHELIVQPDQDEAWWQEPITARELCWPELEAERSILEQLVQTCRELLELEPKSRGSLLTLVLLLGALDPLGYQEETRGYLRALQEVDPLRRGFVQDLTSKMEVVVALATMGEGPGNLQLSGKALTSLPLLEWATSATTLVASGNQLGGLPPALGGLQRLQELDLSHNGISSLEGFPPLPRLQELRLDGNPIREASALSPLVGCPRLSLLRLAGTPLAAAPSAAGQLRQLFPHSVELVLA